MDHDHFDNLPLFHIRALAGQTPVWFQEFSNHHGPSFTFTPDRRRAFHFHDRVSAMSFKRAIGGGPNFATVDPTVFEEIARAAG